MDLICLNGKRDLVVGVANRQSIPWGCAALRAQGAELALTYLNDRAEPHVRPLAEALEAPLFLPCDVREIGQRLGLKEVGDGIWLVSFLRYDLGYIDLEQRTLPPLDNPFGPGMSPMS